MKRYVIGAVIGVILGGSLVAHANIPPPAGATAQQRLNALCRSVEFRPGAATTDLRQACSTEIKLP